MLNRIQKGLEKRNLYAKCPERAPRMVFFTGGGGFREVAVELAKYNHNTFHIINTSDSGRSSRALRQAFNMPAIGDIRSRLIDLADTADPDIQNIVRLLKPRITSETPEDCKIEFNELVSGNFPLISSLSKSKKTSSAIDNIISHLNIFKKELENIEKKGCEFDFRNASIGNLFLAGAYFYYARNLEPAIFNFKELINARGHVIPATLDNVNLSAKMQDGSTVLGQHEIMVSKNGPINKLSFLDRESLDAEKKSPVINPSAKTAIKNADLIVFSMGSFYTSILSTLHIMGMADAIRESNAQKVFIVNPKDDFETKGMSAGSMTWRLIQTLRLNDTRPTPNDTKYLQYVIANTWEKQQTFEHGFGFVDSDTKGLDPAIQIFKTSLTRPESWRYDPDLLTQILFSFI